MTHQEPHGVLLGVNENPRFPAALLLLEPVVEVLFEGGQRFSGRRFELGDRMRIGLEVFEGPGLHEVLLGVLALQEFLVLEIDLDGYIRCGGVRVPVERDAVVLRFLEEDVHGFRRGHLMHEAERIKQPFRRVRIRVHEYVDELVVVEAVGCGWRRQRQPSAVEVGLVRLKQCQ